ncbi:MAG TPA: methionyl-tRNA formyltransferase, partial [Gillisia sp.]|nr:methionyl-tRNA formyltransferase [Gillisia sp.]
MRDLRIVFMGTPEFAVTILKKILEKGYNVAGVITAPDKPAGRGRKLHESAVKTFAVSQGLLVLQPTNLKSPDFIEKLHGLKPNVQVVVAFRMLPKIVWDLPEYGTFNLHASLLPQYRGAAPINWAVINGEQKTGVSTFFLDEKIDTGEIILKKEVIIGPEENVGELHDKLMIEGADLVVKTLDLIKNNEVKTQSQQKENLSSLKEAPKLTRENTRIDWKAPVERI